MVERMSAGTADPPRPSDSETLLGLVDDRLEGAVAQVSEQARNAAALVAAAETTARETRTMVQGAHGALQEIRELLRTGGAARPPAQGGGSGETPAAAEGADHRADDDPQASDVPEAVARGEDLDPGVGADDVDDHSASGGEAGETTAEASEDASQESGADAEAGERQPPDSDGAAMDANAGGDAGDSDEAAATNPPPSRSDQEIARRLQQIQDRLESEAPSSAAQREIIETLGTIRAAQDAQERVIAAAIALTPSAAAGEPGMPPAWQAFQEVMRRLDGIARIVRPVPVESKETPLPTIEALTVSESDSPALPPPAPISDAGEIREAVYALLDAAARSRRAFARFAGIAILLVFLAAGALGVLLQQQYTVLELPDATNGWKDRVWELTGEEIARCITSSSARGGTCAVTVEPAGSP